ncbi:hypothetical protein ACOME3_004184 [Neoechinorhynchus agilis]
MQSATYTKIYIDSGKCQDDKAWPLRNLRELQWKASKLPGPLFILYKFIDHIHLVEGNPLSFVRCVCVDERLVIRLDSTFESEYIELELAYNEASRLVVVQGVRCSDDLEPISQSLLASFDAGLKVNCSADTLLRSDTTTPVRYFIQMLCGNLHDFTGSSLYHQTGDETLNSNVSTLRIMRYILDERVQLARILREAGTNPHTFRSTMSLLSAAKIVHTFPDASKVEDGEGWLFVKLSLRSINHPYVVAFACISPQFPSNVGLPILIYEMSNDQKLVVRSGANCVEFNAMERSLYVYAKKLVIQQKGSAIRVNALEEAIKHLLTLLDSVFHSPNVTKDRNAIGPSHGPWKTSISSLHSPDCL